MSDDVMISGQLYEVHPCPACGVQYTVLAVVIEAHRNRGGYHYCSNGHRLGWENGSSNSELAKLRMERDRAVQEQARLADGAREADDRARRAEAAIAPEPLIVTAQNTVWDEWIANYNLFSAQAKEAARRAEEYRAAILQAAGDHDKIVTTWHLVSINRSGELTIGAREYKA